MFGGYKISSGYLGAPDAPASGQLSLCLSERIYISVDLVHSGKPFGANVLSRPRSNPGAVIIMIIIKLLLLLVLIVVVMIIVVIVIVIVIEERITNHQIWLNSQISSEPQGGNI